MGSRAGFSASVSAWEGNAPPSLVWIARSTVFSDSVDDQTWLN
jgi:hypothetical protein